MKFAKFLSILCLFVVFAFAFTTAAHAAPASPVAQEPGIPDLSDLANSLKNLTGLALLVPALINAAKNFGWLNDGTAPKASLAINTAALVGMVYMQLAGKADLVPVIDAQAGALAVAINAILALIFQLFISRKGHEEVLAGMPVIGKSFSGRHAGEGAPIEIVD